jgi:hypothetical protein
VVTGVSEVPATSNVRVQGTENSFETLVNNIPDHTTNLRRQNCSVMEQNFVLLNNCRRTVDIINKQTNKSNLGGVDIRLIKHNIATDSQYYLSKMSLRVRHILSSQGVVILVPIVANTIQIRHCLTMTQLRRCFRQSVSQAMTQADMAQPIKHRKGQDIRPIHTGLEEEEGESREGGRNSEKTRDRQAIWWEGGTDRSTQTVSKGQKKTSATRRRADRRSTMCVQSFANHYVKVALGDRFDGTLSWRIFCLQTEHSRIKCGFVNNSRCY